MNETLVSAVRSEKREEMDQGDLQYSSLDRDFVSLGPMFKRARLDLNRASTSDVAPADLPPDDDLMDDCLAEEDRASL